MSVVICSARYRCKERHHCGGAKPHLTLACEPCPYNPEAKCEPMTDGDIMRWVNRALKAEKIVRENFLDLE